MYAPIVKLASSRVVIAMANRLGLIFTRLTSKVPISMVFCKMTRYSTYNSLLGMWSQGQECKSCNCRRLYTVWPEASEMVLVPNLYHNPWEAWFLSVLSGPGCLLQGNCNIGGCQEAALTKRIAWRRSGGGVGLGPSGKQLHPATPELTPGGKGRQTARSKVLSRRARDT